MRWQPVSYNGSTIHGTAYAARSGAGALDMLNMPTSDAVFVSRGLDTPQAYVGAEYRPREFSVVFERRGTSGAAPTAAQVGDMAETLKGLFYPPAEGTLVVWDVDDGNKPYYIVCAALETATVSYPIMEVKFAAADPRFYQSTAGTTAGTIATSGGSVTVTVSGNTNTQPIIQFVPTQAKTGDYAWKMPIVTYNQVDTALTAYPVDLATDSVSGAWSTTAAVSGGTIQADGDDVRLFVGQEVDRWLVGMNSGTTRVLGNMAYQPYTPLIVLTAVSASGTPTYIQLRHSSAMRDNMKRMTSTGELYNPATGERMTYSSMTTGNWRIFPQQRGIKGTSAGTIPAGGTLIWLDNPDTYIYYGNGGAEAPITDDTVKPILGTASTNASWVYTEFYDAALRRTAAWKPAVVSATSSGPTATSSGAKSLTYSADQGGTADPATEMGLTLAAWQKSGKWKAEDAVIEAGRLYNPCGFTTVTVSNGQKIINGTSWPNLMGLQKSLNGRKWTTVWGEAKPGTAGVYTNLTANGSAYALGGTFPYLRVVGDGGIAAGSAYSASLEIADLTAAVAQPPIVRRGTPQSNYYANPTIKNETTGQSLTLTALIAVGGTVTIDCAAQTVTYGADGSNLQAGLMTDSPRLEWFDLVPGANNITYTDAGMGTVIVRVIARDEMI